MEMARYKLKNLSVNKLEYGSGAAAKSFDGVTRYIRITDIDENGCLNDDMVSPNVIDEKYLLHDGDILLARTGATVGKTFRYRKNDGRCIYAGFLIRVIPNREIIRPDYLYFFTKSPQYKQFVRKSMKVVAQPNINAKQYGNLELNVPCLGEQDEIVSNLLSLSKIIAIRKQELSELDNLIRARFVEMFGDPVVNEKDWDMSLIEDVVAHEKNALKAGPFGSALKKEYYVKSGYKIYGQEQVISGDHTLGDYYIDEERYKSLENCAVQAGDVLISLVGTYGKLLVMPSTFEPGIINPRLMKITFDKNKVNPYYFKYFFQSDSLKKALADNTHGGTMDILNLGIVRKITMPIPPLKLQNQFVTFIEQVNKSKVKVQKALDETQKLFDSLMQQYFG